MHDFRNLVKKYSVPISVEEETGGFYDYEDGGKWKPKIKTRETTAAVFNLTTKDLSGTTIQYGEGGSYSKEDIKIYIHEQLAEGCKITYKGKRYTVSTELDHADHAHGLRFYIARRAGKIDNASVEEQNNQGLK